MKDHKIGVFYCENAIDKEVDSKGIDFIKIPCSGRLDEIMILRAFEQGADGVLIFACYEGACKYLSGNVKAKKRLDPIKRRLKEIGIEETRVQMHYVQSNQDDKVKEIIEKFKQEL